MHRLVEYYENYKDLDKKIKALKIDSRLAEKIVKMKFFVYDGSTRKEFQSTNINAVRKIRTTKTKRRLFEGERKIEKRFARRRQKVRW